MRLDRSRPSPGVWPPARRSPATPPLLLLLPQIITPAARHDAAAGYRDSTLSAFHSIATLAAKWGGSPGCTTSALTRPRPALMLGLTRWPKATHLASYSYRVRRESNLKADGAAHHRSAQARPGTGTEGSTCDSTANPTTAVDRPGEHTYPPVPGTVRVTFFAQDHASTRCYANADLTKAGQASEILASPKTGEHTRQPGCCLRLPAHSYKILDELTDAHPLAHPAQAGPRILRRSPNCPHPPDPRQDRAPRPYRTYLHEEPSPGGISRPSARSPSRHGTTSPPAHHQPPDGPPKTCFTR